MHHRGEDAPYNLPYPEEGYKRREEEEPPGGDHHDHGHHEDHEGSHHSSLEHRVPPPPLQQYGQLYGDQNEDKRRPIPHGHYEEGRQGSWYPPSRYDIQMSPYPPVPYHDPAGGRTNPTGVGDMEGPPKKHIPGQVVRLFCKAAPDFHLAVVPRQGPVMVRADPGDPHQMWIKDETMSTRVTDSTGAHAFALINKATGQALQHAPADLEQCLLTEYEPNSRDESVLWTQSEDMGDGYRCVRMANKITSNLDVLRGDKKCGGVKEGSPVILFAWKKQENQIWKIIPACKQLLTQPLLIP